MNTEKIAELIKELTNKINTWNIEYYVHNNPSVSDFEYDKALLELEKLEAENPELIQENSPTKFVGGFAENKFKKVLHEKPMLSLSKAYSYEDIEKYLENILKYVPLEQLDFSIEPKIDGLSISLKYINGKLVQATTRGDGLEGEDVTENIYQIRSIPKIINYANNLEVRGEVFLFKKDFEEINLKMLQNSEKAYANARNIASGTLRQLDPKIVKERNLSTYLYELVDPERHNIHTQEEAIKFMKNLNIPTNPYEKIVEIEDLEEAIENFGELKSQLPYDADGLVIKLNNLDLWDKLGKTSKFPKHSIAFKYDIEFAISTIKQIYTTVGRTGKITYVASLEPVELNQTIVRAATLHNYNFISNLKINIGDEVKVIKAGEIIPKVIELVIKNTQDIFNKVLSCPSCDSNLVEIDDNVDQYCINNLCPDKNINMISHFCDRKALNIVGFGISTVKDLYPKYIRNIVDIFNLNEYKNDLIQLNRYGEQKVNNLLNNIEKAKNNPFYKVLFALGIKHIGIRAAKLISKQYGCFTDILEDKELAKINDILNIGTKILESLKEFVQNEDNIQVLLKLDEFFSYSSDKQIKSDSLNGLSFVITGKLSQPRDYIANLIEDNGGHVLSAISKKTNFLVAGADAGSKLNKAIEWNISILSEEDFYKMLKK
ncbi:NAD-dependent DNA ligase LigA [Mycoplasmopsis felifaucium]|uniref:NAD-dependent DNA ligase LigA n=1 Tax=Mycoplasmopsis felifaucium TaxID=35768 RepID=UPI000484E02D|nr:NAD-dependent DNA ligase LigA [Mycoplasmopsis felifaucium]